MTQHDVEQAALAHATRYERLVDAARSVEANAHYHEDGCCAVPSSELDKLSAVLREIPTP